MAIFRRAPKDATNRVQAAGLRASSVGSRPAQPAAFRTDSFGIVYAEPLAYNSPRPLTAAAAQIKLNDAGEAALFKARRSSASTSWQTEAWEYYDSIGEIKYAFNLVASVISRIRLYTAVVEDPVEAPTDIRKATIVSEDLAAAAERALERLNSAYGGQAGLLKDAALNLQVTGECFLVQIPERAGHGLPESWDIRSTDELRVDQKGNYIIVPRRDISGGSTGVATAMSAGNADNILLPKHSFVGRVWKSHPRYSQEADSSLRGLLDLCAELLLLNRTFRATARSRLNAGALYLPDGLSVAASPDPAYPYDEDGNYNEVYNAEEAADDFEDQLIDAMTTPIKDEDSASAVVPLIIRGPADLGDKIKQFKFERSFDPALSERSDRVLERIMQGLDVPKDIVTGLANVKYSNALQIDESLYKAHIEPLMLLIADAFTVMYLRPYLIANGYAEADVNRLVVWYDPSLVATRNDRAEDADNGFDRMAVSLDTWRRAHGFSDQDAPSPTEMALRLVIEKGAITPELTEAMLRAVAPDVMAAARSAAQEASAAPIPPEVENLLNPNSTTSTLPAGTGQAAPTAAPPAGGEAAPAPTPAPETPATPTQTGPTGLAEPTV